MAHLDPEKQRHFAVEVVRRLRAAGFEAYWAGGCVRDQLLKRAPKDYDVATNATPPQIRALFGRRRTLAVGVAFGVITVRGPRQAGMVEVTTFREDAAYSDGRHPDHVTFSSAQDDAARRDFTINGLFYDPLAEQVIDFVGGQADLTGGLIRAIGRAHERFAEDKLRMLRAVRFAATFAFRLEAETLAAMHEMAQQITVVSPERIAMEMHRMLVEPGRTTAVRLLLETGLAAAILPEIVPADDAQRQRLERTLDILDRLCGPGFALALAALLDELVDAAGARAVCRRWRLSNQQTDRVGWLVGHRAALQGARQMPASALQPILIADGIDDLLALWEAAAPGNADEVAYCRALLAQPREVRDPPPLLTGDDLLKHGVRPGPQFRVLLQRIRDAQLDGQLRTKAEALAMVDRLMTNT
jgi:tRNA nucleotidyltransferase/poly(A) polymerase